MPVAILPALAARIAEVEGAQTPITEIEFASGLDSLVTQDPKTLSSDERRGCIAEIIGFRFAGLNGSESGPWDIGFGPNSSGTTVDGREVYFPDVRSIDQEVIDYWIRRSKETPHPTLRARYADLAWEIGRFWNRCHPTEQRIALDQAIARRAVEAYLEAVEQGIAKDAHQAWRFLARAQDLSLRIKDDHLADRSKRVAYAYHRARVASGHQAYWWKLDDLIWERKARGLSAEERQELIQWLEDALARHSEVGDSERFDPHQALDAANRLSRWYRVSGQRDREIKAIRSAGTAFEDAAPKASALTANAWLESLLVNYRSAGLPEDAARVEAAIRARGGEAEQSLKRFEATINIKPEDLEAWLDEITAGSIELAFGRIVVNCMSKEEALRGIIETTAAAAPLMAYTPIGITGFGGFTTARIGSVTEDMPGRVIYQAATAIGASAPFLHQALERVKARHQLDSSRLLSFITKNPFFPPHSHILLKEGVDAWFAQDFVKAIHVLVPQVEAALREILIAMGESALKPNRDSGGFDVLPMGSILHTESFKTRFDPTARLHLRALYTEGKGLNVRNKLAHGVLGENFLGRGVANWVIHSLLLIASMSVASSPAQPRTWAEDESPG